MTFEQFKQAIADNKPDITVTKHGNYIHGNGINNNSTAIMVVFGNSKKGYNYSGSYSQILWQLGIECATSQDIAMCKSEIARYTKLHEESKLKKGLFGRIDWTKKLNEQTYRLEWLQSLYFIK